MRNFLLFMDLFIQIICDAGNVCPSGLNYDFSSKPQINHSLRKIGSSYYSDVQSTERSLKLPPTWLFLNSLSLLIMKKMSLALCDWSPLVTVWFISQRTVNVESVPMSWRHHAFDSFTKQSYYMIMIGKPGKIIGCTAWNYTKDWHAIGVSGNHIVSITTPLPLVLWVHNRLNIFLSYKSYALPWRHEIDVSALLLLWQEKVPVNPFTKSL